MLGDNSAGQTNTPTIDQVKLIAAGGDHTMAAIFSPLLRYRQYPLDVTKDLLLIYNTNSLDSSNVCAYYLQNRPMVSGANVLGIGYPGVFVTIGGGTNNGGNNTYIAVTNTTVYETVTYNGFTNGVLAPLQTWLNNNPTKRPQYVILFLDVPSRVDDLATDGSNYPFYSDYGYPSVSYLLASSFPGWSPFITHINMNGTNDCIAYISKLASIGPVTLVISASAALYGDTNYYFDDTEHGYGGVAVGLPGAQAVIEDGASPNSVVYTNVNPDCGTLACHITSGTNVAGYLSWGAHSLGLGPDFAVNDSVQWSGNSGWWIIETIESDNGQRYRLNYSTPIDWFAQNAFGGIYYSNTPAGAVSTTSEPGFGYFNSPASVFGLWESGMNFGMCAWNSRNSVYFQAVGDPFVTK